MKSKFRGVCAQVFEAYMTQRETLNSTEANSLSVLESALLDAPFTDSEPPTDAECSAVATALRALRDCSASRAAADPSNQVKALLARLLESLPLNFGIAAAAFVAYESYLGALREPGEREGHSRTQCAQVRRHVAKDPELLLTAEGDADPYANIVAAVRFVSTVSLYPALLAAAMETTGTNKVYDLRDARSVPALKEATREVALLLPAGEEANNG